MRLSPLAGLSPATLCVYLAPQQLLCVQRRGRKIDAASAARLAITNPDGHWQTGVSALRDFLSQHATPGQPLEIALSSRWYQTVLAPWSDALLAEPGAARFLQTQLAAVYGEAARHWRIGSDDAPYGQPRLVCGADPVLLQTLQDLAAEQKLRCRVIAPVLASMARLQAPPGAAAIAVIEAGRMTLAALEGPYVTAIQSQPCGSGWHAELAQAWQRWTLRQPELAAIGKVDVVDLSGHTALQEALAPRFQLADHPYGLPGTVRLPKDVAVKDAA
ncbi:hypothetical protein HSX11_19025 [Oxalobacteraceae bacterium]|nr:hypothetical protein [Oxalobacteraceae bacterium]